MTDVEADTPDRDRDPQAAWTNPTVLLIAAAWLASMVLAVGFVVFLARGNLDLSRQLDQQQDRSVCITEQRNDEAQAFFDERIAFGDYVLALGTSGDVPKAQGALQVAIDELKRVKENGRLLVEKCDALSAG